MGIRVIREAACAGRSWEWAAWYAWAVRSRLESVKQVAATLNVRRFVKHAITNGVAEGLKSKIMVIKRKASGFRNPSNFMTVIYFHCGGLDLYPR